jgi:hypothetical protein
LKETWDDAKKRFRAQKKRQFRKNGTVSFGFYYSSLIAPVGQAPSQAPQSMQESASTTYLSSPALIAPTGQAASQLPQDTQSSEITCAMLNSSCAVFGFHVVSVFYIFFFHLASF